MARVYEFLADGFEDIEALAPVDILRRGGVDVKTVSIMGRREVVSAHHVSVVADVLFEEVADFGTASLLLLPGGMPGAAHLDGHAGVKAALVAQDKRGARIGAICAAPMVLGRLGLLRGRRATCYPGFEQYLEGARYTQEIVTVDGNITTGEGPAASLEYGYQLLSYFVPEAQVKSVRDGMMYTHLMTGKH